MDAQRHCAEPTRTRYAPHCSPQPGQRRGRDSAQPALVGRRRTAGSYCRGSTRTTVESGSHRGSPPAHAAYDSVGTDMKPFACPGGAELENGHRCRGDSSGGRLARTRVRRSQAKHKCVYVRAGENAARISGGSFNPKHRRCSPGCRRCRARIIRDHRRSPPAADPRNVSGRDRIGSLRRPGPRSRHHGE